jgi:hypothetical protein
VGLVALNGIPFVGSPPTYFGTEVTPELLQEQIRLGLGFGGVLTYMNRGGHTLGQLAEMSLDNDHDWAMRNITATLCFANAPTFVEMSFARDRRFHLSWVEPRAKTDWNKHRVFTATASLKDWRKYIYNRDSTDFLKTQRTWLHDAHKVVTLLAPEYFA